MVLDLEAGATSRPVYQSPSEHIRPEQCSFRKGRIYACFDRLVSITAYMINSPS